MARTWLAAALAFIYPGLGHLYLKAWFRAVTWFGLSLLTAALVVPPSVVAAVETGGIGAIVEASRNIPADAYTAILVVRVMNVFDAAWLGLRHRPADTAEGGPSCPNCDRDLDADLDFCHWCTTPLDGTAEERGADGGLS